MKEKNINKILKFIYTNLKNHNLKNLELANTYLSTIMSGGTLDEKTTNAFLQQRGHDLIDLFKTLHENKEFPQHTTKVLTLEPEELKKICTESDSTESTKEMCNKYNEVIPKFNKVWETLTEIISYLRHTIINIKNLLENANDNTDFMAEIQKLQNELPNLTNYETNLNQFKTYIENLNPKP